MSRIYNLTSSNEEFTLAGYRFRCVDDYADAIRRLPGRGGVKTAQTTVPGKDRYWVKDQPHSQGLNVHTFDSEWIGSGPEPSAFLVAGAPLLSDIMLLLTLWGERRVFQRPDGIDPTESPYYWPDFVVPAEPARLKAVEDSLNLLGSGVPEFPFNKVLALLTICDQSSYAEVKGLLLMPCFDMVTSATPAAFRSRSWSPEQKQEIKQIRKRLNIVLDGVSGPTVVDSESAATIVDGESGPTVLADAVRPFRGDIERLGSQRMADKIIDYYRWALDWMGLPEEVIVSQAKALNVVRNALVHRAAAPEKITVEFTSRPPVVIPKGDPPDHLLRAQLYLTLVNHSIIKRQASSLLGLPPSHLFAIDRELRSFFAKGIYNDVHVFEEWFQDRIIG